VWYNSDERARDCEVHYLVLGLCFINPASMCGKSRRLPRETCGTLSGKSRTERRETGAERATGVSRGRTRGAQAKLVRHSKAEEAEERIGGAETRTLKA
jgi:hypothetical protein